MNASRYTAVDNFFSKFPKSNLKETLIIIFGCFLLSSSLLADDWNVGFQIVQISDPVVDSNVEVAIWYPTKTVSRKETVGMTVLNVAKEAEPISFSRGLIIISHGFSGNFLGHNGTAQFLAKHGYVVATPTHPDLFGLRSGRVDFDPLVARPRHIKLVIDELLNKSLFKTILLEKHIGIIGFSLGAYAALNASGAQPDLSGLAAYCKIESQDFLLCGVQARRRLTAVSSNLLSRKDSRIDGVVLLAPAYGPLFTENSFANVTTPVRIFSAEKDKELDGQHHAKHFEKLLSFRAVHEVVKNAGHFVFMSPCSNKLKLAVPTVCQDDEFIDRVDIHRNLNRDIISFF